MDEQVNVFISHYHKDVNNINDFKELMKDAGLDMRNSSITPDKYNDAHNKDYIKTILRPLIKWAGTFICLIGKNTYDSEWVDWEIRQAQKQGKRIIGVYCLGAKDSDIPDALNDYADAIIGWRKDKIAKAINGESSFENSDGNTRPNINSDRTQC